MVKNKNIKLIFILTFVIIEIFASLYIYMIILPQLPMLMLGYPLKIGLGSESRIVIDPRAEISDNVVYISFYETGFHIYCSIDDGI